MTLTIYALPAFSDSICSDHLKPDESQIDQTAVDTTTALIHAGTDPLTAARIAKEYPEIAEKILSKQAKGQLEWMVLYRGLCGTIEEHDPYFFRVLAPPYRVGLDIGMDTSDSFRTALAYAVMSPYHRGKGLAAHGVVLEFKIPKFLVQKGLFGLSGYSYSYIKRHNSPELDLWLTRYSEIDVQEILPSLPDQEENNQTWKPYSDYYFSPERMEKAPGPLLGFMMKIYRIWNRVF